jgi:homoserine kinase
MSSVTVRAPATVSNVVCGFDCLGFALTEPFDEVTVSLRSQPGISIEPDAIFGLPTDPTENVAGVALAAFARAAGYDGGFEVTIRKGIKPGSGIGSSAASSCGAVFAANILLDQRFAPDELIGIAMSGEERASGSKHADNVAPCIMGGFVLVRSADPLDVVRLEHPPLWAALLHPQIEIRTAEARAMLPTQVPLADAVRNWSNLGAFVAALASGDLELLSRSMEDCIIEPARKRLIPGFDKVVAAARSAGTIGAGISGSGPSMFALCASEYDAHRTVAAMLEAFGESNIEVNTYLSPIDPEGVRIL